MQGHWYIVVQDSGTIEDGEYKPNTFPVGVAISREAACEMAEENSEANRQARLYIYVWRTDGALLCPIVLTGECGLFGQVLRNEEAHYMHRDAIFNALYMARRYAGSTGEMANVTIDGNMCHAYLAP